MAEAGDVSGRVSDPSRRVPLFLACLLLAAPLSGESSTGKTRATATTTVSVSIPVLYGISLLEEGTGSSERSGVVLASLADGGGPGPKIRLAILTTIDQGSVVLSRSLTEQSPAGEPTFHPAGHGKSHDGDLRPPAFFSFPSGAFGWRSLEQRLPPERAKPASNSRNPGVARVVYELWQF